MPVTPAGMSGSTSIIDPPLWLGRVEAETGHQRLVEPHRGGAGPAGAVFEWSRSVENPSEYVLGSCFGNYLAGVAHVNSDHFRAGLAAMPPALSRTP